MTRRRAQIAAVVAGMSLALAGCGGGGGSDEVATPTGLDPALAAAAEPAAASGGLAALGVVAPDPADGHLSGYETLGTPADVFTPRVSDAPASTAVPTTTPPATTPTTTPVTSPAAGTTTTPPVASFVP